MTDDASRKRNRLIAWVMLIIGLVVACEGLYYLLMADRSDKLVQTLLGGILIVLSAVFFTVSRKPKASSE